MPNFFCQIPWENSRFTYLGSVFIFSCLPVHSESVHWFWTILTKGRFMLRLSHAICKADSQHLKGFKICWISLFLFSFYCITISVLLCLLFLGFSYWDLGKPCSILPTYPPRHVEQDLGQIMLWQDNKRGRAHVPLWRENLMHKIKTHKWERDANKTFSIPEPLIFHFKTFCERCCKWVNKYKTISEWYRRFVQVHQLEKQDIFVLFLRSLKNTFLVETNPLIFVETSAVWEVIWSKNHTSLFISKNSQSLEHVAKQSKEK